MARVHDLWVSKKTKERTPRYGSGRRWQVRWVVGGKVLTEAFRTKDEAQEFAAKKTTEERNGSAAVNRDMTMAELWEGFRKTKNLLKSQGAYDAAWEGYLSHWASERVRDIRKAQLREWLPTLAKENGDPVSGAYAGFLQGVMKALLQHGIEHEVITQNPLAGVKRPQKKTPPRRYLNVGQLDALLAAAAGLEDDPGQVVHDVVLTMARTMARRGEVVALAVKHLDVARRRLRVEGDLDDDGLDETKSGKHRDLPVHGDVLAMLQKRAEGKGADDLLFLDPKGRAFNRHYWRVYWNRIRTATGIKDFDTHELRHTGVSMAIKAGASVKAIQAMCGHASATVTLDTYGHLWDEDLDAVFDAVERLLAAERKKAKVNEK